jgi:ribonuclease HII
MANREFENTYIIKGFKVIAGLDEAGRGPLAGPVVIACVVLPNNYNNNAINDSKKINKKMREFLYQEIINVALAYHVEIVDEKIIHRLNIYQATKWGMEQSLKKLSIKVDVALTDAMPLSNVGCEVKPIIKGDAKSITIAAASILAKVTRDRIMLKLDAKYPQYDFKNNKGYPTKFHLSAIKEFGITKHHRRSFKPVSDVEQLSLFDK